MPKMHNLTQILSNLWHKVKRDSSAPTLCISQEDIVVFVVGPTGSGKSWFTREATSSELVKVSRDHHPFTSKVHAIRCELIDETKMDLHDGIKGIVFVDTPSFLTGCDYPDAQTEIQTWLDRTQYQPKHVGVIYIHRVETNPALEPMQGHLKEFAAIPRIGGGSHLPQRIHVVMSYDSASSNVSESKITERKQMLRKQMSSLDSSRWYSSMHGKLFQGDPEVAWRAVEELLRDCPWEPRVLS